MLLNIITPEKILFEGDAAYVQVCGTMGEFGVLPNHAPLVSSLKAGVIGVDLVGGERKEFVVESGVAEVLPDRVTLLVTQPQASE